MSYQYIPLPAPHYIRLLDIAHTSSDVIELSVKVIDLNDDVQYKCLSYTWDGGKYDQVGDEWSTPNQTVLVEGQTLLIRKNLHDALAHLRLLKIDRSIWIDAISLNQADVAERNSQVSQMSRIYENAQEVVVWLGTEDAYSALAIRSMHRLEFTMEEALAAALSKPSPRSPPWMKAVTESQFTDKEIGHMINFMVSYRWFSRLWTVQELLLASTVIFVCGTIVEPLETIWKGSFMPGLLWLSSSWDRLRSTEQLQWATEFGVVCVTEKIRRKLKATRSSIGIETHRFRNRQATDPRDKVFGVVSISCMVTSVQLACMVFNMGVDISDECFGPSQFVIDYTKSVQAVYTEVSVVTLVASKGLEPLSWVGDRTKNQVQGLPTWVPDVSQELTVEPFQTGLKAFLAASNFEPSLEYMSEHPQAVVLNGIHYDTVTTTSTAHWALYEPGHVSGLSSIYNLVLNPQPVTSMTKEKVHTILSRTLTGDGYTAHDMDPQYDMEAAFDRWLFYQTCDAIGAIDFQLAKLFFLNVEDNYSKVMESLGVSGSTELFKCSLLRGRSQCTSLEDLLVGDMGSTYHPEYAGYGATVKDEYSKQWKAACMKRCLFRTERGYLGLGLPAVHAGDRIYLLQGAPVPYIFRHRDTDPHNVLDLEDEACPDYVLELEGEAYVHGIMYGEAVRMEDPDFERIMVL